MKILLIILAILFGGVSSFYSNRKKAVQTSGWYDASDEPFEGMESDDADDDSFFDYEEEAATEAEAGQPEYFTYEAPDVEVNVAPVKPMLAEEKTPAAQPWFDLRQAVIWQAVLDNRYVNNDWK